MRRVLWFLTIVILGAYAAVMLVTTWRSGSWGDLGSFVAAGRAASQGINPYGVYPLTARAGDLAYPNLNPPVSVLLFQLLGRFEPPQVLPFWYAASLAAYVTALLVLVETYPQFDVALRVAWALSLSWLWQTLQQNEIYLAVVLVGVLAWVALIQRKETMAGVLLGLLVAIKPNFLLWPVLLFPAGYRRVSLTAAFTAAALSFWPAAVYGPSIYPEWLAAALHLNALRGGPYGKLVELAAALGHPSLGLPLTALVVLALAALIQRRRPSDDDACGIGIVASLILLPWTLEGYLLLLLPIFFSRPWNGLIRIVVILLAVPWLVFPQFTGLLNDAALLGLAAMYLRELVPIGLGSRSNLGKWAVGVEGRR